MSRRKPREEVIQDLLASIQSGTYGPDDKLPSEVELARRHNCARQTARGAYLELAAQGMVESRTGSGWYLRKYRPLYWHLSRFEVGDRRDDPDTGTDEWAADMREQGREPRQVVSVAELPAPKNIADYLGLMAETPLVRRRRLRYADDEAVSIADTWLPEDIANLTCVVRGKVVKPFLMVEDIAIPGGIVAAVGIKQRVADDRIVARMPSQEEIDLLEITSNWTPVLDHVRVGIDDTGRRIRALISVSPGDRLCLRYRLHYRNGDTK